MSGRYEPIADRYLDPVIRGSNEFMCTCPFCAGKSSLQFNIDNGLWVCFRCDAKGNSKMLVKRMGGTYTDPVVSVEAIRKHMDRLRTIKKREGRETARVLDETVLRRYNFPDDYWSVVRGFSDKVIEEFQLGYDPIKNRNIIPFRNDDGELLGVIERLKDPNVDIRYIYYEGFDRKNSLFGSWRVRGERRIGIVEGSTDVVAMADAQRLTVAQFGSSISSGQIRLLHRLGIHELVMFYDYDEAGRKAEEKSRTYVDGIVLRTVVWDTNKYCWHKKLCGCGEHTWRNIANCQKKRLCTCGRRHEMDPGSLKIKERQEMFDNAVLVGSKKKWPTRKFA
jgi:hypothetical protein